MVTPKRMDAEFIDFINKEFKVLQDSIELEKRQNNEEYDIQFIENKSW